MDRNRTPARDLAEEGGMTHVFGRDVQGFELRAQLLRFVHQWKKIDQGDALHVVQAATDEIRIAVAALLAVGEDVGSRLELRGHGETHSIIRGRFEVGFGETSFIVIVDRLHHPTRSRPAADPHDRKRCDGRGRGPAKAEFPE